MYQLLYSNNKDLKHCMCLILLFSFYCTCKEQTLSSIMWLSGSGRLVSVSMLDSWIVAIEGVEPHISPWEAQEGCLALPSLPASSGKEAQKSLSVQELQLSFSLAVLLNQDC